MNFCTKCGTKLKENARFCHNCGETVKIITAQKEPEAPVIPQIVLCSKCGKELRKGSRFCVSCGTPVDIQKQAVDKPQVAVPLSSNPLQAQPVPVQPLKKKSSGKKAVIVISIIVFLGLVGAVGWYFFGDKIFKALKSERPEYIVQKVVPGTTTVETKEISGKKGSDVNVKLSDESGVVIRSLKNDIKIKFVRDNNNIKTGSSSVVTSGSMRSLTLEGNGDITSVKPVITFPKSEVGSINPATINIVRVSDVVDADGSVIRDQVDYLPVTLDKNGNYSAIDFMFPSTASSNNTTASTDIISNMLDLFVPSVFAENGNFEGLNWVANVKYSISTFQGSLNWSKDPKLVQMTPDANSSHFRHPATYDERKNRKKPIVNVVILVHGHNEEEKGGDVESSTGDIWEFNYKRDVWNYLYKTYLDMAAKANGKDKDGKLNDCTVFYEFIYPTYRPIFTPVPKNSVVSHKTLGEYLGEMIKEEFLKNNSQIAKMIKEKIPFNIYMVGHSMGGLVARAGLRNFDSSPEIWNNFKQLITWGTPHQGSPLVTLRYIAAAGFDIKVDDLPFYPYGNLPKKVLGQLAMDTPGNQDLRWTGGSAGIQKFFNFDMFFRENSVEQFEGKEWDLRGGSMFYNDNLRTFNENEKHSDKLTTLYGTTSKTADVRKEGLIFKAWHFYHSSELGQGAYLIRLLAGSDELKASDGAVPVYSQTGRGLFPMPSSISMGDCDHEQFFGAMGTETAEKTFEVMNNAAKCDCPTIDDYKFKNDSIGAKLKLPMDSKPGDRIKKIKVELEDKKTNDKEEPSVDFEILSNGKFNGELGMDKNDIEKKTVSLVMTFKDESEITYEGSNVLLEGKWNVRGIIEKLVIYTGDEEPTLKGTSTGEHMVDFYQIMEQGFTTKKDGDYIICAPPNADKPNAMYTKYRIKFTSGDEFTGTKTMKGTMNTLQIENITGKRIK